MSQSILGCIAVVAGICIIVARKRLARESMAFQNKVFKFHFGEKEVKASEFVVIVSGVGFIVLGALAMLNIVKWS
jgi:hypothetical protein